MAEARAQEIAQAVVSTLQALDAALTGDGAGRGAAVLQPDTLALFAYEQARPLGGIGDLVDWRLGGAIGQAQARGHFLGRLCDQLMVPAPKRLGSVRVFVFGLGPASDLTFQTLTERLTEALQVVADAGGKRLAWALPPEPHPLGCPNPQGAFDAAADTIYGHIIGKLLQP